MTATIAAALAVGALLGWLTASGRLPADLAQAKKLETPSLPPRPEPPFHAGAQAQETTSVLVKQLYDGKWPDKQTVEQLNKQRLYLRAVQAYMTTLPALNQIGIRDGSEGKFGKGYNVLPIWKDRMNAKTLVPTPNCDVIYSMS
jgi:hypothetical protein